ncbi:MAG: serine hydrolase [Pseudomonadales bacterium]|jgi:CubicO group peptidase (beta-lactamase class C family)|nr:serine hydrolase [Pseudomonadales bacterium]
MSRLLLGCLLCALAGTASPAPVEPAWDYFAPQRELIRRGVQAVLMCNGLFTSERTLEQVFAQELAYLDAPIGSADGGDYRIDPLLRAVEVGVPGPTPVMRAAFRDGLGCVVLAPDQDLTAIDALPRFDPVPPAGHAATLPWPDGDLVPVPELDPGIDATALQAASDWAFDRATTEQDTLSLLVLHHGRIIHERYAPGIDRHTRTRTWSTAKSIAVTLVGMLVDRGDLSLDAPLPITWLPREAAAPETDPRRAITLRHVLNMSSGLEPVDSWGREYATGSGLSYWAGASSAEGARRRGLIRAPGTSWDYENYDTLLAVQAMKEVLGSEAAYQAFPRTALLDRIGMDRTLVSTDRFGDFVLSSQVYANARDLARFGLLYAQNGVWNGERLLSEAWIDFVRTPAPASAARGNHYGGQFWLVPDGRDDVPRDAYATSGNRGQYVIIVPSKSLVIVRRGLDWGRQGFDRWDLLREVLRAFP